MALLLHYSIVVTMSARATLDTMLHTQNPCHTWVISGLTAAIFGYKMVVCVNQIKWEGDWEQSH